MGAEVEAWSPGPQVPSCLSGTKERQSTWLWAIQRWFWLGLAGWERRVPEEPGLVAVMAAGATGASPASEEQGLPKRPGDFRWAMTGQSLVSSGLLDLPVPGPPNSPGPGETQALHTGKRNSGEGPRAHRESPSTWQGAW